MSVAASRIAPGPRSGICATLLAALLVAVCPIAAATPARSLLNKSAPEFARTDLAGRALDLRSYRGRVVLLNFWASWCAPCQIEMPVFAAWQRTYSSGSLQVIAISMDDDAAQARPVVSKLKLNYPVAMGDEKLGALYGGVLGLPLTYLIDKHGIVRARFQGETDLAIIEKQMKLLLAKP